MGDIDVAGRNYGFTEDELSKKQVKVLNATGRKVLHNELVLLDGYFGEVTDFNGIADDNLGYINIDSERAIETQQIADTQNFVRGGVVYYAEDADPSANPGALYSVYAVGRTPVGIAIDTDLSATYVKFMPFVQRVHKPENALNMTEVTISANASAGLAVSGIPLGAEIIDVVAISKATVTGATVTLKTGAGSPVSITDAIDIDTINVLARAALLVQTAVVVGADGLKLFTASAADRALVRIFWR